MSVHNLNGECRPLHISVDKPRLMYANTYIGFSSGTEAQWVEEERGSAHKQLLIVQQWSALCSPEFLGSHFTRNLLDVPCGSLWRASLLCSAYYICLDAKAVQQLYNYKFFFYSRPASVMPFMTKEIAPSGKFLIPNKTDQLELRIWPS